jgi:hypothetical protein
VERLQTYFPTTLADWDRRERMYLAPDGRYDALNDIPSPIHVINLARELNVGSILPAAFYDLARYEPAKTARGTEPLAHVVLEGPSDENSPMSATCTPALVIFLARIHAHTPFFFSLFISFLL